MGASKMQRINKGLRRDRYNALDKTSQRASI